MPAPKRIYLSGPMTGIPEHNFPAFHETASYLRRRGYEVFNPAESFGGETDLPRPVYMRKDLGELLRCDCITFLPGWQSSRGALAEALVAQELGLEVQYVDERGVSIRDSRPVPLAVYAVEEFEA